MLTIINPPNIYEKQLMERYIDGDEKAFRELHAVAAPRLHAFLKGKTATKHAPLDDIIQHTFLKMHRTRETFVRGADPMPWLRKIAWNTFIDERRAAKRKEAAIEQAAGDPTLDAGLACARTRSKVRTKRHRTPASPMEEQIASGARECASRDISAHLATPKQKSEPRKMITFHMTVSELAELDTMARRVCMSRAYFIRQAIAVYMGAALAATQQEAAVA